MCGADRLKAEKSQRRLNPGRGCNVSINMQRRTAVLFVWWLLPSTALGQTVGDSGQSAADGGTKNSGSALESLPWSVIRDDPIGLERSDEILDTVHPAANPNAKRKPTDSDSAPAAAIRSGNIVTAPPAVRETAHRVWVQFTRGLALVTESMRFSSSSPQPAEVLYRLPTPADAALRSLRGLR